MSSLAIGAAALKLPLSHDAAKPLCLALEEGAIVRLGPCPLPFTEPELAFLRTQRKSAGGHHKNVAYRPKQDRLTGYAGDDPARMRALMRRFSEQAVALLQGLLSPYKFDLDYASFRPIEEEGRAAKQNARNDLLHVDAFPTRPSRGRRILRFFINLNPTEPRIWRTGPPFAELARQFAASSGLLERYQRASQQPARASLLSWPPFAQHRPPYDRFMLDFHDWLKAQEAFQNAPHTRWEFEPMSSWMVMTDTASHAVARGRLALEQTVLVLPASLQATEIAPSAVLAGLAAN
jgi:3-deoxy-D-manno-oct-2-ulosonic acid (Kdo) hydroxylase